MKAEQLKDRIDRLQKLKEEFVADQRWPQAARLRVVIDELKAQLKRIDEDAE